MDVLVQAGRLLRPLVIATLIIAAASTISFLWQRRQSSPVSLEFQSPSIMGTETTIKVVVEARNQAAGKDALRAAETALRSVESAMSIWLGTSELSRLNQAPPGVLVPLSVETLSVLHTARQFCSISEGAFDATCLPISRLWKQAETEGLEPSAEKTRAALRISGWRWFRLHDTAAEKLIDGPAVDLGGIAKGYAVDRAMALIRKSGAVGGMIQCGGEIRVFGKAGDAENWRIAIRSPFGGRDEGSFGTLELAEGAISTSGNYERYFTVNGRRYSHILDPRTGRPVDSVPQVTVFAPSATISDGWSTALTVLGPAGLRLAEENGVEAMLITGTAEEPVIRMTAGFKRLLR